MKIIDYGLALHIKPGDLGQTPCGTVNLTAPEQLESGYDSRVDVWGLGLITYMLHTGRLMFQNEEQLNKGIWSLTNLDCSAELVRFITDTVAYDREKRPFPDKVKDHPYFSVDVDRVPSIRSRLYLMSSKRLESFGSHIEPTYLQFDSKNNHTFNEFYEAFHSARFSLNLTKSKTSPLSLCRQTESPTTKYSSTKLDTVCGGYPDSESDQL